MYNTDLGSDADLLEDGSLYGVEGSFMAWIKVRLQSIARIEPGLKVRAVVHFGGIQFKMSVIELGV